MLRAGLEPPVPGHMLPPALQQQLAECQRKISSVEELLTGVRQADAQLADVRRILSSISTNTQGTTFAASMVPKMIQEPQNKPQDQRLEGKGDNAKENEKNTSTPNQPAAEQAEPEMSHKKETLRDQVLVHAHMQCDNEEIDQENISGDDTPGRVDEPDGQQGNNMKLSTASVEDGPSQYEKEADHSKKPNVNRIVISTCSCLSVKIPWPIISPESKYRMSWDLCGLVFIIFETYAIPYYIAFQVVPDGFLYWWMSFVNVYFMFDIAVSFMTGYRSQTGVLVMSAKRIAKRYVRGWLIPDVLAGVPWEWLQGIVPVSGSGLQVTKMLRLLRIARLLRLVRSDIMTDRVKMIIEANPLLVFANGVARVLFILFGITHWAACIWYSIGDSDKGPTWVKAHVEQGAGRTECYIYALYFTLTTMTTVGYGDITPTNYGEVCFASILLLVATVVFAALMGSLTDLIGNLNSENNVRTEKVMMLSRYMTWRSVPRDLFMAVRKHLLYLWETNKGYDAYEDEIKEQLPPVLRKELCYHIYGRILRSAPFLAWMRDYEICLKDLSNIVQPIILSKGDSLFRVGTSNEATYMLISGKVRVSLNESLYNDIEEAEDANVFRGFEDHRAETLHVKQLQTLEVPRGVVSLMPMLSARSGPADKDKKVLARGATKMFTRKYNLLEPPILMEAVSKLEKQDMREKWAARYIQRLWRKKKSKSKGGAKKKQKTMKSKSVDAPAYFGESCFWVPHDEWDTGTSPVAYMYSARCECRCELVIIRRSAVTEVLERYGDWLISRFEGFRCDVVDGLKGFEQEMQDDTGLDRAADTCDLGANNVAEAPVPAAYTRQPETDGPPLPPTDWNAVDMRLASDSRVGGVSQQKLAALQSLACRSRAAASRLTSLSYYRRPPVHSLQRLLQRGIAQGPSPLLYRGDARVPLLRGPG